MNDPLLINHRNNQDISILTYNVQTVFGKDENKMKSLSRYINREKYDFVLLQEMFDEEARNYIIANRDTAEYQSVVARIDYNSFPELIFQDSGLFLMSRYPQVDLSHIDFDDRIEVTDGAIHMILSKQLSLSTDFLANKSIMGSLHKIDDSNYAFVFTTHVQAIGSRSQKRRQYRQIHDFISYAVHAVIETGVVKSSENLTVLLTGDFNSDAYDEDDLERLTSNLGSPRDLHMEANPFDKEYTMRFRLFNFYRRFDYIFAYDNLGSIQLKNVTSKSIRVTDIRDSEDDSISDHLAVKASISIDTPVLSSPVNPADERTAK